MKHFICTMLTTIAVAMLTVSAASADTITVGGKNFTEQLIMASMTAQLLRDHGYKVDKRDGMGSTVLRKAEVNGQVDLYWEYTGTSLIVYNKKSHKGLNAQQTADEVRRLDAKKGLVWLKCSNANDTYALAVKKGDPATAHIHSISDLAAAYRNGKDLKLALDAEFSQRKDGLPGVEKAYDFKIPRPDQKTMQAGLTYKALHQGQVGVAMVFATDGRISAFNLRVLKDNKHFFPNYALCPVVRKETLKEHPKLRGLLDKVSADLDDSVMQKLNKEVDVDKKSVEDVAKQFLQQHDLT